MKSFVKVERQGKPIVNVQDDFVRKTKDFVVAEIDMKSKWCCVEFTSSSWDGRLALGVSTTERSLHLSDKDDDDITIIYFPNYDSRKWNIFVADCCRYTLRVVLERTDGAVCE